MRVCAFWSHSNRQNGKRQSAAPGERPDRPLPAAAGPRAGASDSTGQRLHARERFVMCSEL